MRRWILICVALAACKGDDKAAAARKAKEAELTNAALVVPKVSVASVLAVDTDKPPFLLVVEADGARVGAADSWADLDAGKLNLGKRAAPADYIDRYIREAYALGRKPSDVVAEFASTSGAEIDLASLEDPTTPTTALDDPPPPEEEDKPDDGEDESGGTGNTVTLDEGRVEGQYKMQKNQDDPQLARQQAIEQARTAGLLGGRLDRGGGAGLEPQRLKADGTPSRVAKVQGSVLDGPPPEPLRTLIFIAPSAKATRLIDVIGETSGSIAVSHAGKIRPLRLHFQIRDGADLAPERWLEVRVSTTAFAIEAVPDIPVQAAKPEDIAAALTKAREARSVDAETPVDVLVDPEVDAQRLVDVLVALDTAGVRQIGLGPAPNADEAARRGRRIPSIAIGQPHREGDLEKSVIRRHVKGAQPRLLECYTKVLRDKPELAGTVQTQFFIAPNGTVVNASGSGVDPAVASCIADVIKGIEFPKPRGGGGVQVSYPFTLRP